GRYPQPGNASPGIPHRLDRPVSGVVVFARNTKAARRLAEQFQNRRVEKVYWAAVEGDVRPEEGVWEDWLLKIQDEARAERVGPDVPGARRAVLRYRRPAAGGGGALLGLRPESGAVHPARVDAWRRGRPGAS